MNDTKLFESKKIRTHWVDSEDLQARRAEMIIEKVKDNKTNPEGVK